MSDLSSLHTLSGENTDMPRLQLSKSTDSKQVVVNRSGSDLDLAESEGRAGFKGLFENRFM